MFIIMICGMLAGSQCSAITAVNGTDAQCRAMLMSGQGRVTCIAPDGTVIARIPTETRR